MTQKKKLAKSIRKDMDLADLYQIQKLPLKNIHDKNPK